ncbi:Uncharacterised protein [Mycobacteroides abscessus subsp. abscessus]|nr:Uncharacterised protein [Mycobacteroides abscessus subsp. abscessus]
MKPKTEVARTAATGTPRRFVVPRPAGSIERRDIENAMREAP